jgi:hypothetical protein
MELNELGVVGAEEWKMEEEYKDEGGHAFWGEYTVKEQQVQRLAL